MLFWLARLGWSPACGPARHQQLLPATVPCRLSPVPGAACLLCLDDPAMQTSRLVQPVACMLVHAP
ncbi:hypothetical protein DLM_2134 [Aquitalea magnusonii]|uniref:Uncharacterized protein n=1 Tax=Aquitalea magnusonii TaxID=332411 RepID=A0A3G9GGK0_9NEIS|nr:hypothetical protein DLM_2134 [Aquitalea magnusonii]